MKFLFHFPYFLMNTEKNHLYVLYIVLSICPILDISTNSCHIFANVFLVKLIFTDHNVQINKHASAYKFDKFKSSKTKNRSQSAFSINLYRKQKCYMLYSRWKSKKNEKARLTYVIFCEKYQNIFKLSTFFVHKF